MKYIDYDLDLTKDRIVLDKDLTIEKLEWQVGDHFEVKENDGRIILNRVDPLIKFLKGYQ